MTRHLRLDGIDNFRDYGDYAGLAGRRLRPGRLYRSAAHSRATDADLEAMAALGIAAIVDLRRQGERLREPSRRPVGFTGQVIESAGLVEEDDSWRTHIAASDLSEQSFLDYIIDYYRRAPFDERHIDLFTRYFRILADAQGPVLIHCAAGKDRTGLLAALTHHVAGVHPDDILADYLLTNDAIRMDERVPLVRQNIGEIAGRIPTEAYARRVMGVDADYLHTAITAINDRYGDLDAYLEQALGVDARLRAELEASLLA